MLSTLDLTAQGYVRIGTHRWLKPVGFDLLIYDRSTDRLERYRKNSKYDDMVLLDEYELRTLRDLKVCESSMLSVDPPPTTPVGMTVASIADALNITTRTFYHWRQKGKLPTALATGQVWDRTKELQQWINQHQKPTKIKRRQ